MDLKLKIDALAEDIKRLEEISNSLKKKQEWFEKENKQLIEMKAVYKETIEQRKNDISKMVEDEFNKTGNKKFYGGIGIRVGTSFSYDHKKAFEFAKEKDLFLSFDKKAFEAAIKSLSLDFVKSKNVTTVTFPKEIKTK